MINFICSIFKPILFVLTLSTLTLLLANFTVSLFLNLIPKPIRGYFKKLSYSSYKKMFKFYTDNKNTNNYQDKDKYKKQQDYPF